MILVNLSPLIFCFTIGQTTDIHVPADVSDAMVPIYTLRGMKVATVKRSEVFQYLQTLPHGIYIVDGKKIGR
ncbi:hypothetical protein JHU38_11390 [Prevotella sp. A2931]|uniref:Uncharacterized protein n=1 Tax=Prevotella illustrans TaxID=2800387 RepID=A0ABS3M842_9BACT|nr:hypothetical protein [Prevotella sp. oral taxon 820]MBO1364358.1 hypothetical protein [Prevotella illustrans]